MLYYDAEPILDQGVPCVRLRTGPGRYLYLTEREIEDLTTDLLGALGEAKDMAKPVERTEDDYGQSFDDFRTAGGL